MVFKKRNKVEESKKAILMINEGCTNNECPSGNVGCTQNNNTSGCGR